MNIRLLVFAVLIAFDLAVALTTSLTLITPTLAVCLLIANPVALIVDRQIGAQSPAGVARTRRR